MDSPGPEAAVAHAPRVPFPISVRGDRWFVLLVVLRFVWLFETRKYSGVAVIIVFQ